MTDLSLFRVFQHCCHITHTVLECLRKTARARSTVAVKSRDGKYKTILSHVVGTSVTVRNYRAITADGVVPRCYL